MRTKNLQDLEQIPKEILHLKWEDDDKIMGEEPAVNQEEKKVWCYRKQETNKKNNRVVASPHLKMIVVT